LCSCFVHSTRVAGACQGTPFCLRAFFRTAKSGAVYRGKECEIEGIALELLDRINGGHIPCQPRSEFKTYRQKKRAEMEKIAGMPCGFDHRKPKVVAMAEEAMAPYAEAAGLKTKRAYLMEQFGRR
jgi:hypothetical protein